MGGARAVVLLCLVVKVTRSHEVVGSFEITFSGGCLHARILVLGV